MHKEIVIDDVIKTEPSKRKIVSPSVAVSDRESSKVDKRDQVGFDKNMKLTPF